MASPDTDSERPYPRAEAHTPATVARDRGIIRRWRNRRAERRLARLMSHRNRRALAERLRRTANDAADRNRPRRGLDVLLHYRAAAVRTQLLEIAALLERARDPDPACIKEMHQLLANGDSPLYHPGVHVSELYATLYYVRARLITQASSRRPMDLPSCDSAESPPNLNLPSETDRHARATRNKESHVATPGACPEHRTCVDARRVRGQRRLGALQHWRERRAERKHARLMSARNRRALARWLRLIAKHATDRDPIRRRHDVLLHHRAEAVRTDLLEIAALLERAREPNPDCVAALYELLANHTAHSPLYNPNTPFTELQATLDYVRLGL